MSLRITKVTERLRVESDYTESHHRVSCYFDNKKVLQAYQGFYDVSRPNWSVWGKYGYDHSISKEEFKRLYDEYAAV
jgi:hypothetical protein